MKAGDRVSFNGRQGTVKGFMPKGMVDVLFDDAPRGRIERRRMDDLTPVSRMARMNSGFTREEAERARRWAQRQVRKNIMEHNRLMRARQRARWREILLAWAERLQAALDEGDDEELVSSYRTALAAASAPTFAQQEAAKARKRAADKGESASQSFFSPSFEEIFLTQYEPSEMTLAMAKKALDRRCIPYDKMSEAAIVAASIVSPYKRRLTPLTVKQAEAREQQRKTAKDRKKQEKREQLEDLLGLPISTAFKEIPYPDLRSFLAQPIVLPHYMNTDLEATRAGKWTPSPHEGYLTEEQEKELDVLSRSVPFYPASAVGGAQFSPRQMREMKTSLPESLYKENFSVVLEAVDKAAKEERLEIAKELAPRSVLNDPAALAQFAKNLKKDDITFSLFHHPSTGYRPGKSVERLLLSRLREASSVWQENFEPYPFDPAKTNYEAWYDFFHSAENRGKSKEEIAKAWKDLNADLLRAQREAEREARKEDKKKVSPEELLAEKQRAKEEAKQKAKAAQQERQKRLKEIESALKRSAAPLPSSRKSTLESVADSIRYTGAGYFARPDPPRLSPDRSDYCGNPIDGVAYYLIVDNRSRALVKFITWDDVIAMAEGGEGDGEKDKKSISRKTFVEKTAKSGIRAKDVLLDFITQQGLRQEDQAGPLREELNLLSERQHDLSVRIALVREVLSLAARARPPKEISRDQFPLWQQEARNAATEMVLGALQKELKELEERIAKGGYTADAASRAKEISYRIERLKELSPVPAVIPEQANAELVEIEDRIKFLENQLSGTSLGVRLSEKQKEYLSQLQLFVRKKNQKTFEQVDSGELSKFYIQRGDSFQIRGFTPKDLARLRDAFSEYEKRAAHSPYFSVAPVTSRASQYIRLKKTKGVINRGTRARPELIGPQRKSGGPGAAPDPNISYSFYDSDRGQLVHYMEIRRRSPNQEKFSRFKPYDYRRITPTKVSTLSEALVQSLGADPAIAEALVVSGAVSVKSGKRPQIVTDPTVVVAPDKMFRVDFDAPLVEIIQQNTSLSEEAATSLIKSGRVLAQTRTGTFLVLKRPATEVVSGRNVRIAGNEISVWLKDKSSSPFFSWTKVNVPIQLERALAEQKGNQADGLKVCLGQDDKKVLAKIEGVRRSLNFLKSSLSRIRGIFKKAIENPESLRTFRPDPMAFKKKVVIGGVPQEMEIHRPRYWGDANIALFNLFKALASVVNRINALEAESEFDESATLALDQLEVFGFFDLYGRILEAADQLNGGEGFFEGSLSSTERIELFPAEITASDSLRFGDPDYTLLPLVLDILEKDFSKATSRKSRDVTNMDAKGVWPDLALPFNKYGIVPALSWLKGSNFVHPADDLILSIWPELTAEDQVHLSTIRTFAVHGTATSGSTGVSGVERLRNDPAPLTDADEENRSSYFWADYLMSLGAILGQGGIPRKGQMFRADETVLVEDSLGAFQEMISRGAPPKDVWEAEGVTFIRPPVIPPSGKERIKYQKFDVRKADSRGLETETLLDHNWAVGVVLDLVYPTLLRGTKAKLPAETARHLLLLAALYRALDGFEIAGPLNPSNPCYSPDTAKKESSTFDASRVSQLNAPSIKGPKCGDLHKISQMIDTIDVWTAAQKGGASSLSSHDNFSAYMTYNPVLFEMARLFWPKSRGTSAQQGVLHSAEGMAGIDAVGSWGQMITMLQKAAVANGSEEGIYESVREMLLPAMSFGDMTREDLWTLLRGPRRIPFQPTPDKPFGPQTIFLEGEDPEDEGEEIFAGEDPLGNPIGHYSRFNQLWPLGVDYDEAVMDAERFMSDPVGYLYQNKIEYVDPAISWIQNIKKQGTREPYEPLFAALRTSGPTGEFLNSILRGETIVLPDRSVFVAPAKSKRSEPEVSYFAMTRIREDEEGYSPGAAYTYTLSQNSEPMQVLFSSLLSRLKPAVASELKMARLLAKDQASVSRAGALERDALLSFQRNPGMILRSGDQGFRRYDYTMEGPATGNYDAQTLKAFLAFEEQPVLPPDAEMPALFTSAEYDSRAGRWKQIPPLPLESATVQVAVEAQEVDDLLRAIREKSLKPLDEKIAKLEAEERAKAEAKKAAAEAKTNSRRRGKRRPRAPRKNRR